MWNKLDVRHAAVSERSLRGREGSQKIKKQLAQFNLTFMMTRLVFIMTRPRSAHTESLGSQSFAKRKLVWDRRARGCRYGLLFIGVVATTPTWQLHHNQSMSCCTKITQPVNNDSANAVLYNPQILSFSVKADSWTDDVGRIQIKMRRPKAQLVGRPGYEFLTKGERCVATFFLLGIP